MAYVININPNSAVTLNLIQGQVMLEPFQHCTIDFKDEEFAKKNYNDQKLGLYYAETENELKLITETYKKRNAIADETNTIQEDEDLSENEGTETTETSDTEKELEIIKGDQSFDGTIYANYIPKVIVESEDQLAEDLAANATNDITNGETETTITEPINDITDGEVSSEIAEFKNATEGLDQIPDELLNHESKNELLDPESPTETLQVAPIEFEGEVTLNGCQVTDVPTEDTFTEDTQKDADKEKTLKLLDEHKDDLEYLREMGKALGYPLPINIKAQNLYMRLVEFVSNK